MNKPLVFNYKDHEELKQAYKELLEDNNKLIADNKRLRKENANLQIKLRIMEADNETACAVCIRKRTAPGSTTNEESKKTKTAGLYVDEKTGQGDVQRAGREGFSADGHSCSRRAGSGR